MFIVQGLEAMKLTIHRGTKEIGGSCIELQTLSTRLIFDIGLPLVDRQGNRLDNRKYKNLDINQLQNEQIAPVIDSLYEDTSNLPDALLLSHSHLDHYGLLPHIHPSIPVYCSLGTKRILEIAHFFEQSQFIPESVHTVDPWKEFQIGDFTITPYMVDHSAIDAFSYLIEAEEKRIFYSGDIRSHGRKSVLFEKLLEKPPENIDYLILDGSVLGRDISQHTKETDIEESLVEQFSQKGGCVISFASQNIDRLVSVFKACLRTKRTLVVDPYTAYILDSLREMSPNLPQFNWGNGFKIFFVPNSYTDKLADTKKLYKYKSAKITMDEIIGNMGNLVLKDNFKLSRILKNKGLLQDTKLIYSLWEGYLEDDNFWQENNVPITHIHCSGHAYREDLIKLVGALNPKRVIPNHTFHPEQFPEMFGDKVVLLEDGKRVEL